VTGAGESPGLTSAEPPPHAGGLLGAGDRAMLWINRAVLFVSMLALVAAALVLTYSVLSRYFLHANTDWQDEAAVFCLVGATFLCGAWVQGQRGHIGIEAVASILPRRVNHVRQVIVDVLTLAFCAFFAWKSWTLFREAWVDHQTTSSTWAPPLAIPYGLMSFGMTLLVLQLLLQCAGHAVGRQSPR
jgi:TRAP-type C4-dicarboxylate transport system permease small subunit